VIDIRNVVKAGYTWQIFAEFPDNTGAVRVAVRKTPEGAARFAEIFYKRNKVNTYVRLK
jgi:hypothetical protein